MNANNAPEPETTTAPVDTRTVTLQPIAMLTPTRECIYAPSGLRPPETISYRKFLTQLADRPISIMVSFEPDHKSNPQAITAYGFGCSCWYIVVSIQNEGGAQ